MVAPDQQAGPNVGGLSRQPTAEAAIPKHDNECITAAAGNRIDLPQAGLDALDKTTQKS